MSSNAKAALLVAVAFVAGLFVGISGDRLYLIRTHQFFPRRAADSSAHRLVDRLDRELDLTDAQQAAIQKIVDERRARIEAAWNEVRPRVRAEIAATNAEIEKILTPQQREKFRSLRIGEPRRGHGSRRPL